MADAWSERIVPGRFAGKTAIVTGAGSGIGRAAAARIAREGGRVVATDVDPERLTELERTFADLDLVTIAGDVAEQADVERVVAAAGDRVDGLVNNAGIMDRFAPVHEVDDATWERVLRVNVTGLMRMTRAIVPGMLAAGSGSIVNVTSEAGFRGSSAGVAYTASKHAVLGITRSSAFMYAPTGIRVNAVAPGAVRTNIVAEWGSTYAQGRIGPVMQATMTGVAQPEEVAAAIAWLLSDDAPNVNGALLTSDGGWSAV
ncbi:MAG: SDR family NAD(P)-dependent oxidoreductase [Actinomycetota bacterium]